MKVQDVKPGMTGYGLTVFHGTEPEPFAFEVISVQHGFAPDKSVVWVRCPDPRMQQSGPVQGMSGSPMFIWTDDKPNHKIGKGGKLIGAFAYGHGWGKDCYVGIQPIEQMLHAAARLKDNDETASANSSSGASSSSGESSSSGGTSLRDQTLLASWRLAQNLNLDENQTWRLKALSQIANYKQPDLTPFTNAAPAPTSNPLASNTQSPMMLPVSVGSTQQANYLKPFFAPMGLAPQASGAASASGGAGLHPNWIKPETITQKPGGVFAIPLTFGPLEMAAIGTTTEVLPDGTTLAFGHSFFAQGSIKAPMATGFVHFVQPSTEISFKLGGSLKVNGTLLRDESTAVIGKPGIHYTTIPVNVSTQWEDSNLNASFNYEVVQLERLVPSLVGSLASSSIAADTEFPRRNTLTIEATLNFAGNRSVKLIDTAPMANPGQIMLAFAPSIATLSENEFGSYPLKSIDAKIKVQNHVRAAIISAATVKHATVRPGDDIIIDLRITPYRSDETIKRITIPTPADLPDGNYAITIGGARTYQQVQMSLKPHRMSANNIDELFDAVQDMLALRDDALYTVLRLAPGNNLALGRTELPNLPSSRMALLAVKTSSRATPFGQSIDIIEPYPYVLQGAATLQVEIKRYPNAN